jgi:hypothetical protein
MPLTKNLSATIFWPLKVNMHYLNTTEISKVGALLADSARTAIIVALCKETALPAGELAERAGISASTASIHPPH